MLLHFDQPIPCTTPLGNGYILYVRSNGMLENDEFTIMDEIVFEHTEESN